MQENQLSLTLAALKEVFPEVPRVVYERAPAFQVTCQVRFPAILKIDAAPPADFQELIRNEYPLFEHNMGLPLQQMPAPVVHAFRQSGSFPYQFLTANRRSTVAVTVDSLALSTADYGRWEVFKARFFAVFQAFMEIYAPQHLQRIGLRYQNIIDRAVLGLDDVSWSELLQPHLLGELAVPALERAAKGAQRALSLATPDGAGTISLQHALVKPVNRSDLAYMIDLDLATTLQTEVRSAESTLDNLHDVSRRAFRWCLAERLHDALVPREVS